MKQAGADKAMREENNRLNRKAAAFLSAMVPVEPKKIFIHPNKESQPLEHDYVNLAFLHPWWLAHFRMERCKFPLPCGTLQSLLRQKKYAPL